MEKTLKEGIADFELDLKNLWSSAVEKTPRFTWLQPQTQLIQGIKKFSELPGTVTDFFSDYRYPMGTLNCQIHFKIDDSSL